jgi:hypothetical protein
MLLRKDASMKSLKTIGLGRPALFMLTLLLWLVPLGCGAFGGHGGKNLTAPVTGLTATASSGQVALNWNAYPGAQYYGVWRGTTSTMPTSGGIPYLPASVQNPPTGTTFTDTTVTNGTTYYYAVSADGNWGVSNFSNIVSATP